MERHTRAGMPAGRRRRQVCTYWAFGTIEMNRGPCGRALIQQRIRTPWHTRCADGMDNRYLPGEPRERAQAEYRASADATQYQRESMCTPRFATHHHGRYP